MPTLDARGRVTLPLAVREGLGLRSGGLVVFVFTAEGWVLRCTADKVPAGATPRVIRNTGQPGSG